MLLFILPPNFLSLLTEYFSSPSEKKYQYLKINLYKCLLYFSDGVEVTFPPNFSKKIISDTTSVIESNLP